MTWFSQVGEQRSWLALFLRAHGVCSPPGRQQSHAIAGKGRHFVRAFRRASPGEALTKRRHRRGQGNLTAPDRQPGDHPGQQADAEGSNHRFRRVVADYSLGSIETFADLVADVVSVLAGGPGRMPEC